MGRRAIGEPRLRRRQRHGVADRPAIRTVAPGSAISASQSLRRRLRRAAGDGFKAHSITADGGNVRGRLHEAAAHRHRPRRSLGAGLSSASPSTTQKPFCSIMRRLWRGRRRSRLAQRTYRALRPRQTVEGMTSKFIYHDLRIDGFADGKLASFAAGPIRWNRPRRTAWSR